MIRRWLWIRTSEAIIPYMQDGRSIEPWLMQACARFPPISPNSHVPQNCRLSEIQLCLTATEIFRSNRPTSYRRRHLHQTAWENLLSFRPFLVLEAEVRRVFFDCVFQSKISASATSSTSQEVANSWQSEVSHSIDNLAETESTGLNHPEAHPVHPTGWRSSVSGEVDFLDCHLDRLLRPLEVRYQNVCESTNGNGVRSAPSSNLLLVAKRESTMVEKLTVGTNRHLL